MAETKKPKELEPVDIDFPIYDTTGRGPKRKYDWQKLKMEFLEGPWKLVRVFWKEKFGKDLEGNNNAFYRTKGWQEEKKLLQKKAIQIATDKLLSRRVDEEKDVLARQQKIGKLLQSKGIKFLKKVKPKNAEEVRKLIATGVEIEAKALGLYRKKGRSPSLTQVNVNLPRTRFDGLLDELDYRGILRLLAEIKHEGARRTAIPATIEGTTETN